MNGMWYMPAIRRKSQDSQAFHKSIRPNDWEPSAHRHPVVDHNASKTSDGILPKMMSFLSFSCKEHTCLHDWPTRRHSLWFPMIYMSHCCSNRSEWRSSYHAGEKFWWPLTISSGNKIVWVFQIELTTKGWWMSPNRNSALGLNS